jgi:oligopeptide transport system substrate-binding protein
LVQSHHPTFGDPIEEEAGVIRNLFLVMALIWLAGCGAGGPSRPVCPKDQRCLHIGNTSEPVSLDPQRSTGVWEDHIQSDMFVGLTQDAADGSVVPGMAESWSTSPDGRVWTFHLRDAQWSDGAPVTADDFVFSLRRVLDPKTASEYASLLYLIHNAQAVNEGLAAPTALGVRALDRRTLEIRLDHPAPYLPQLTKHHVFYPVPRHVVERWGDAWIQPAHFVGNGPFKLVEWRLGDHVRLVRNPRFYAADTVCIDQLFYYPTNNAISAERRVLRGELDINTDIQSNRIAYLRGRPASRPFVRTSTYLGVAYLAFNNGQRAVTPALRDVRVRRALAMAIDREFITLKLLRGGQLPAYSFVPPGVANYVARPPRPYWAGWSLERRQAEARRLLRSAGFGPGHRLKLDIKHRNTPDPLTFMPASQADWKAIGVEATLTQNVTQIAYQSYRLRDFDVADASWIADYNDPMSFLYLQQSRTGAQNYGDYDNPVYDALIAKADDEPNPVRRAGYLARAERIMLTDAPIAPLYFYVNKNLVSPRVTGWVDNIVDHHRSRYLCLLTQAAPRRAPSPSK